MQRLTEKPVVGTKVKFKTYMYGGMYGTVVAEPENWPKESPLFDTEVFVRWIGMSDTEVQVFDWRRLHTSD